MWAEDQLFVHAEGWGKWLIHKSRTNNMFCTTDYNSYLSIRFRIWFFNYFPESRFFARGEVGEKFAQESDLILSVDPNME